MNTLVMRQDSGIDIDVMRVDGGPVNNAFLMHQADILGIPRCSRNLKPQLWELHI